jgi:hypothetical protein
MNEPIRSERSLRDEALLRGSDDLLVDFDRAFRVFQEFVGGCAHSTMSGPRSRGSDRRASTRATATTGLARDLGGELARRRYTVITGCSPGITEAAVR